MSIQLSDDGSLDTVLSCSECHEEFRYTFDGEGSEDYDAFVDWAIEDASSEHACIGVGGYTDCGCRDCFDIAIGRPGSLCHDCREAGCKAKYGECERADAYGVGDEEDDPGPGPGVRFGC